MFLIYFYLIIGYALAASESTETFTLSRDHEAIRFRAVDEHNLSAGDIEKLKQYLNDPHNEEASFGAAFKNILQFCRFFSKDFIY